MAAAGLEEHDGVELQAFRAGCWNDGHRGVGVVGQRRGP